MTGIASSRQASASTSASSGSPCVVRSPARARDRSTSPAIRSKEARSPRVSLAAMDVARGRDPHGRSFRHPGVAGYPEPMANESFDALLATLEALGRAARCGRPVHARRGPRRVGARGPESDHDLDLMVKPEDAEQALATLAAIGLRPGEAARGLALQGLRRGRRDGGHHLRAGRRRDRRTKCFAHADELEVEAQPMLVMSLDDVLVTKLLALDENPRLQGGAPDRAQPARAGRLGGGARARRARPTRPPSSRSSRARGRRDVRAADRTGPNGGAVGQRLREVQRRSPRRPVATVADLVSDDLGRLLVAAARFGHAGRGRSARPRRPRTGSRFFRDHPKE